MQFESFSEFMQMGGHGTFVWSVYLITAAVVLGNIILPLRSKKQFFVEQAARSQRENTASSKVQGQVKAPALENGAAENKSVETELDENSAAQDGSAAGTVRRET